MSKTKEADAEIQVKDEVIDTKDEDQEFDEEADAGEENCEDEDGDAEMDAGAGGDKKKEEAKPKEKQDVNELSSIKYDTLTFDELLKVKIKLSDGSENFLFSRGPKYSDSDWPIICHLCRNGNLKDEKNLREHLKRRAHLNRVKKGLPLAEKYNEPFFQWHKDPAYGKAIKIFPGEFITDPPLDRLVEKEVFEVKPPEESILKELENEPLHEYNKKMPLIGLSYIYKMKCNDVEYVCVLCNTKIDGEAFKHIVGAGHQLTYIEKHFRKLRQKVVDGLKKERDLDLKFLLRHCFRKLYRKIENIKGYRTVTCVDYDDYCKNMRKYRLNCLHSSHYDENTIMITEKEVDVLIRKCINGIDFIKPDLISLAEPDKGTRAVISNRDARMRTPPPVGMRQNPSRRDYADKNWRKYHQMIERDVADLNTMYQTYNRYHSRHPLFDAERIKFRQRRGKRANKSSWITFWKNRLVDLYEKDLSKRKYKLKSMLRLNTNVRTPSPEGRSPSPYRYEQNRYDDRYDDRYNDNRYDDNNRYANRGYRDEPRNYDQRGYSDQPGRRDDYNVMDTLPPQPQEPLGVISVLRLLTALEEQLGSLGSQAVQLLSRAVLAEKNDQNPNDLMRQKEYYIFFVTAKEKLKGQLFANLVDNNKMPVVNRAVKDATTLIDMFEDYMRRKGEPLPRIDDFGTAPVVKKQPDINLASSTVQYSSFPSSNQYQSVGGGGNSGSGTGGGGNQYTSGGLNQYSSGGNQYGSGGGGSSSAGIYTSDTHSAGLSNQQQYRGDIWRSGASIGVNLNGKSGSSNQNYTSTSSFGNYPSNNYSSASRGNF